jgi:anti-sigma regulatory factor (Ser/Thr protein kinase)
VVLHAGQSAPAYTVAATVDNGACRVEVTDAGQGCSRLRRDRLRRGSVDHGALDRGPADHGATERGADHSGLAESGRGFAIMRECVDAVTLRSAPGRGTRVVLDKRISLEAPLPGAA